MTQAGHNPGTERMWWWKAAKHLDEAQIAIVNALAHNVDDPSAIFALQQRLREGQAILFEIFQAKQLLPGSARVAAEHSPPLPSTSMSPVAPMPSMSSMPSMPSIESSPPSMQSMSRLPPPMSPSPMFVPALADAPDIADDVAAAKAAIAAAVAPGPVIDETLPLVGSPIPPMTGPVTTSNSDGETPPPDQAAAIDEHSPPIGHNVGNGHATDTASDGEVVLQATETPALPIDPTADGTRS